MGHRIIILASLHINPIIPPRPPWEDSWPGPDFALPSHGCGAKAFLATPLATMAADAPLEAVQALGEASEQILRASQLRGAVGPDSPANDLLRAVEARARERGVNVKLSGLFADHFVEAWRRGPLAIELPYAIAGPAAGQALEAFQSDHARHGAAFLRTLAPSLGGRLEMEAQPAPLGWFRFENASLNAQIKDSHSNAMGMAAALFEASKLRGQASPSQYSKRSPSL